MPFLVCTVTSVLNYKDRWTTVKIEKKTEWYMMLRSSFGSKVIIDRYTQNIRVDKNYILFHRRYVIPFSAVFDVAFNYRRGSRSSGEGASPCDYYQVCINYQGEKYTEDIVIADEPDYEKMLYLREEIRKFVGKQPG